MCRVTIIQNAALNEENNVCRGTYTGKISVEEAMQKNRLHADNKLCFGTNAVRHWQ